MSWLELLLRLPNKDLLVRLRVDSQVELRQRPLMTANGGLVWIEPRQRQQSSKHALLGMLLTQVVTLDVSGQRITLSEREGEELRDAAAADAGRSSARRDLSLLIERGLRTKATVALSRANGDDNQGDADGRVLLSGRQSRRRRRPRSPKRRPKSGLRWPVGGRVRVRPEAGSNATAGGMVIGQSFTALLWREHARPGERDVTCLAEHL